MDIPNFAEDEMLEEFPKESLDKIVIVFTCNWNAYNALETAGVERISYSSEAYPLKVMCLGQLSPGIILKAFEKGADGVLLLGCPPSECHFEFGNRHAEEVIEEVRQLIGLLGYQEKQLVIDWANAGQGKNFAEIVNRFLVGIKTEIRNND